MSIPEPQSNSIALVTGASSGIGEQFARQLYARGYRVALVARRKERLQKLAKELGGSERAVVITADLALARNRSRVVERLEKLEAQVDVLVNNAGFGVYKPFVESGPELELKQVHLLVEAVVDLISRYLPSMVQRRRGAVINMSSTAGFQALPYNAGYAAAKSHVLLLSEALNAEVKDSGVAVTAVCPGPVPTEFQETSDAGYFAEKLPKFTFVPPERVVSDALKAADKGRPAVIPGGPAVRASFAPNRLMPTWATLPVTKRMMERK